MGDVGYALSRAVSCPDTPFGSPEGCTSAGAHLPAILGRFPASAYSMKVWL